MLTERDATSRHVWQRLGSADDRCDYHFARAWFADCAMSWLFACLALEAHGGREYVQAVIELGMSRSPDLKLMGDDIVKVMASLGLPEASLENALRSCM